MIIKNLTRKKGTGQLIGYLFRYFLKEDKTLNVDRKPLIIKHNLRSNNIESWTKQFRENEALRLQKRKDNILVHHTIISFSNRDKGVLMRNY